MITLLLLQLFRSLSKEACNSYIYISLTERKKKKNPTKKPLQYTVSSALASCYEILYGPKHLSAN